MKLCKPKLLTRQKEVLSTSATQSTRFTKKRKIFFTVVGLTISLLAVLVFFLGLTAFLAYRTFQSAAPLPEQSKSAYQALKNQDLNSFKQKLDEIKISLDNTQKNYQSLRYLRFFPLVSRYYQDGEHGLKAAYAGLAASQTLAQAIEPYADVLGFSGQDSFTGGTVEDRVSLALETLAKIMPAIDQLTGQLKTLNDELAQIDARRYPYHLQGRNLDETILNVQNLSQQAIALVVDTKPLLAVLPQIMAVDGEKKYLVLFQNDAELRATGGFMTAYGIMRLQDGKVFTEKSDDIYALDQKFNQRIPPPDPIKNYLPLVYYWYLRDMNLSPDFKVSMDTFFSYYQNIPGEPKIDGIIAIDTQLLNHLLTILGPVEVPGFGTYTSQIDERCDCPQVIYELELLADRPTASIRENRKGVLAPLMQAIIAKTYTTPRPLWPQLFQAVFDNIKQKHVLFYFLDGQVQKAFEAMNFSGRIKDYQGDYLHLNDVNFAGAKSNMFTSQTVDLVIDRPDQGEITHTLTIKYDNPFPASNCNLEAGQLCLNGILRDFFRLYLPAGSQLLESIGFTEDSVQTYSDLGKTVIEGFFKLSPASGTKLVIKYKSAYQPQNNQYQLLIQKQPGTKNPQYTVSVGQQGQQFDLLTDKELVLNF